MADMVLGGYTWCSVACDHCSILLFIAPWTFKWHFVTKCLAMDSWTIS